MNFCIFDSKKQGKKYNAYCQENNDFLVINVDGKWECRMPSKKIIDLCIRDDALLNFTIDEFQDKLYLKTFNAIEFYVLKPIEQETNMDKFCVFDSKKEKKYDVFCQINNDIVTVNVEYNNDKKWRCFIPLSIYLNFCIRENTLLNYTINNVFNGIYHADLFLKHIDNKEIHLLNLIIEQENKSDLSNVRTISSNIVENKPEVKIECCNVGSTGPIGMYDPIVENKEAVKYIKCEKNDEKPEIKNDEKPPVTPLIQEQILDKFFSESFAKLTFKVEGKIMGLDFNASVEKKI
jgi:hypothetical protein